MFCLKIILEGDAMNKVIVCDDNKEICKMISILLEKYRELYSLDIIDFCSAEQLLQYCRNNKFNVIYLDIELGDENGLNIARELKEINPESLIIYISSHDDYYRDMVQAEPFRFIRKDLSDIEKFERELISTLADALKRLDGKSTFLFEFNRKTYRIELDKVKYFYSKARTIHICGQTGDSPEYYYGKMEDLYIILQDTDKRFVQVNKSYIVNMDYVRTKGKKQIVVGEDVISLTSRYQKNFWEKYFL